MIIKGASRFGPVSLAAHLSSPKNEQVSVVEIWGLLAHDLLGALREMEDIAAGSACRKFMYHANIDPHARFPMSAEQWREAVDALEAKLGFTGQPRAVVMHMKEGREHRHVVWSRIDPDSMRGLSDSHNYRKHEEVSRDLERRFGHDRVQGAHAEREGKKRPERTPSREDIRQQERTGKTGGEAVAAIKAITSELTALWGKTRSGREFAAALSERGYILAQGDRRDFVVVDREGVVHSLPRRIKGERAASVRARMADVDRAALPTVAKAVARAKAKRHEAEAVQEDKPIMDGKQRDRADIDAAELEKDIARQPERQAAMLAKMERQEKACRAYLDEQKETAARERAAPPQPDRKARAARDEIADPKARYARALTEEYQVQDPYGSLARAAVKEYSRFAEQQDALTKQIAIAKTPDERRSLELRKTIEGCDYMVITSQRLAGMGRVIGGPDSEQARRDDEKAKFYMDRARDLRAERERIGQERGTGRPDQAALRPGEAPRTVEQHRAVSQAQEAEKWQREQQARTEHSGHREDRREARSESTSPARHETPTERDQRRRELLNGLQRAGQENTRHAGPGGGRGGGKGGGRD